MKLSRPGQGVLSQLPAQLQAAVAPPVTALLYDLYSLLQTELQRYREAQRMGDRVPPKTLRDLTTALKDAYTVETQTHRDQELAGLSDEALERLLAEASEAVG